jgi:very-short-patch-repair endonuclease
VHDNHYIAVETAAVLFLREAFAGEEYRLQHPVGPYFIDMYFPRVNLAIECDEGASHSSRLQISSDTTRQAFIENALGCEFIRFRPHDRGFSLAALVNTVFLRLR